MDEHDIFEREQREFDQWVFDVARESSFAYWGALLTANSIVISIFSAVLILLPSNNCLLYVLVGFSIPSASLIILNYKEVLGLARYMGFVRNSNVDSLTPNQMRFDREKWKKKHSFTLYREHVVHGLLVLQAILIILLLFTSHK